MPKKRIKNDLVASDASASDEDQINEILAKFKSGKPEWLMITQQLIFPSEGCCYGTKEDFISDLGSALTCHYRILAVYHQGRRISASEIAAFSKEALDLLGPISRARANGLF